MIYASTCVSAVSSHPMHHLIRIRSSDRWTAPEHSFLGEPVFVPHPQVHLVSWFLTRDLCSLSAYFPSNVPMYKLFPCPLPVLLWRLHVTYASVKSTEDRMRNAKQNGGEEDKGWVLCCQYSANSRLCAFPVFADCA